MGQQALVAQQVFEKPELLFFEVLQIFVDLLGQLREDQDQQSLEHQQVLGVEQVFGDLGVQQVFGVLGVLGVQQVFGDLGVQLVFVDWLDQDNIEIRYLDHYVPGV